VHSPGSDHGVLPGDTADVTTLARIKDRLRAWPNVSSDGAANRGALEAVRDGAPDAGVRRDPHRPTMGAAPRTRCRHVGTEGGSLWQRSEVHFSAHPKSAPRPPTELLKKFCISAPKLVLALTDPADTPVAA
jgi:DNA-binding transcriptional LysR family regulator